MGGLGTDPSICKSCVMQKGPNVLSHCHTKRRTGMCGYARPSFCMTTTFYIFLGKKFFFCLLFCCCCCFFFFLFEKSVSYQKEGRSRPCSPVLLVWQRLRPSVTFSRGVARMTTTTVNRQVLLAFLNFLQSTFFHTKSWNE